MTRSSVMQHSQMAFMHGSRATGPHLCWILALLPGCTFIIIIFYDCYCYLYFYYDYYYALLAGCTCLTGPRIHILISLCSPQWITCSRSMKPWKMSLLSSNSFWRIVWLAGAHHCMVLKMQHSHSSSSRSPEVVGWRNVLSWLPTTLEGTGMHVMSCAKSTTSMMLLKTSLQSMHSWMQVMKVEQ